MMSIEHFECVIEHCTRINVLMAMYNVWYVKVEKMTMKN